MKKIALLFQLILGTTFISKAQDTIRVLFIGNSYTYVNDLPNTFRQLAASAGKVVEVDNNAPGGYTFQQHTTNATTLSKINQGNWDFVVLQEQSQMPSFPPGQVQNDVFPYAQQLDQLIHQADSCTKTVFYMTWGRKYGDASNCGNYSPLCTYEGMQMRLRNSYLQMAQDNNAMVAPAGMAWRSSWYNDSTINLWSSDFSHPSLEGTYLTACTFYSTMFREPSSGLSYTAGINAATASFLQHMADSTVLDSLGNWISYFDPNSDTSISYVLDAGNPMTIHFTGNTTNTQAIYWDFEDETFSNELNPTHTFPYEGVFTITKVVQTPYCGTDTITLELPIEAIGIGENLESGKLILKEHVLELPSFTRFEINNIQGQTLYKTETNPKLLDLSPFPPGIYVLNWQNSGRFYHQKINLD